MLLTILVFILSFILAFGMITYKAWQFRTGKIVPESYEEADWTDISIESIRTRLVELVRFAAHHTILVALKFWILFTHWIRRTDAKVKRKLYHFLHKNAHLEPTGKPSSFISNIKAHKESL